MDERTNIDRRATRTDDRRADAPLPRLIDTAAALDAVRQALAIGEALADERRAMADRYAALPAEQRPHWRAGFTQADALRIADC